MYGHRRQRGDGTAYQRRSEQPGAPLGRQAAVPAKKRAKKSLAPGAVMAGLAPCALT